jgi:hypothetical protein
VELHRQRLFLGYFQRAQNEVVVEGFVSQAYGAVALCPFLHRAKCFQCFMFARVADRQAGAIGNDTFQANMPGRTRAFYRRHKRFHHLVECLILQDQFLCHRLQPQNRLDAAHWQVGFHIGYRHAIGACQPIVNQQHWDVRVLQHARSQLIQGSLGSFG